MAKYGKKAQDKVERAMHEMKEGKLKSGSPFARHRFCKLRRL